MSCTDGIEHLNQRKWIDIDKRQNILMIEPSFVSKMQHAITLNSKTNILVWTDFDR